MMLTGQIAAVASSLLIEVVRLLTGRLFTEKQVRAITSDAIGRHFADLFPTPDDQRTARDRIEQARQYIEGAGDIIAQMQQELSLQSEQLDRLLSEIDQKQKQAEKYEILAETGQEQFMAFREEIEEALRKELRAQANKGRRLRQVSNLIIWLLTLVLGAWLGAYFKDVEAWIIGLSP